MSKQKFYFKSWMSLVVVVVMIAGAVMLFCPCSHAESTPQPAIQNQPCHHCCPEINASSVCDGVTVEKLNTATLNVESFKLLFKAKSPNEIFVTTSDVSQYTVRSTLYFSDFDPLKTSPLYLSLQVLRI